MSWSRLLLAACLLLSVSACGFKLRGDTGFPPDITRVYVQADNRYTPFYRELATAIRNNGLKLATESEGADATVRVLADETGRRSLTVSARNVPREYEIYYLVRCSVDVRGGEFVPEQQFILTRDYTYDETEVLGKANEEDMLREALARQIVGLLAQTISAAR